MTTGTLSTVIQRPEVLLNGGPIAEELEANLLDARVELVTNGVSQATLRFYDADFELLDNRWTIGASLEISFPKDDLTAEQGPTDLHELVVTAFDMSHRLARNVEPRVLANVKYSDIVSTIASRSGLRAVIDQGGVGSIVFPHLLQTGDDQRFLTEIALRTGTSWRVSGDQLIVGRGGDAGAVTLKWGQGLRRFTTRVSGAGPLDKIEVRGWDVRTKRAVVSTPTTPPQTLNEAGMSLAARNKAYSLTTAKKVVSNRTATSQQEATQVANAIRSRLDSGLTQAKGEAHGNPDLAPGVKLTVEGMGARFSGHYVLTAVEHVYTVNGFVTRFQAGTSSASTLVDLLQGPQRTFHGPTIGLVTNNRDQELNLGRVKLKLPMISESLETDWARVVALGAGPSRGLQMIPAVNDEVLVVFEDGDLRRPVVIGGLWNSTDPPPKPPDEVVKDGATPVWHLQTKAGHKLTFDERADKQPSVTILLKDGKTKLYLGMDKIELWADRQPIEVKTGESSIKLTANDVTVTATNVNIKAQAAVKIEGATVEIAAKAQAKVNGSIVEVKGTGAVSVESTAILGLKGMPVKIN
jgi:phage protein D/phage baseplate assembly protein gpV